MGIQGFRGGMPVLSMNAGSFSPTDLWLGVWTGKGIPNARVTGAGMLAISWVIWIATVVLVWFLHRYYPYFLVLAGPMGWAGLFLLITGEPGARPDGSQAPMWGRLGAGVALAFGVLQGIGAVIFLHF